MKAYVNGNYKVLIDEYTGHKIRYTNESSFKPEFPESIDVTITKKCRTLCKYCYLGCKPSGLHADLTSSYVKDIFIPSLKPYTELALNGNDLDVPNLLEFLHLVKQQNVFANITVSQGQLLDNLDLIRRFQRAHLIKGVGVSIHSISEGVLKALSEVDNIVLHYVVGISTPDIVEYYHKYPKLFLGYKKIERGIEWYSEKREAIDSRTEALREYLVPLLKSSNINILCFDNKALSQLEVSKYLSAEDWKHYYQGDEGSFTFYVDLVDGYFGRTSYSGVEEGLYKISGRGVSEMFKSLKEVSN